MPKLAIKLALPMTIMLQLLYFSEFKLKDKSVQEQNVIIHVWRLKNVNIYE